MTTPRQLSDDEIRYHTMVAARLGGCTCEPEITLRWIGKGVRYAEVAHDRACGHLVGSGYPVEPFVSVGKA